jgi:hypothetical protein
MTKADIGQLLSDQVCEFISRKAAMIEPEVYDDEDGDGYEPLDRWMDRKFRPIPAHMRWSE